MLMLTLFMESYIAAYRVPCVIAWDRSSFTAGEWTERTT